MKECDKRNSHISSKLYYIILYYIILYYISSNDDRHPVTMTFTPLHSTSLNFTLLHYTCRQFTSSHLNLFNKTPPNAKVHVTSCAGSFAKDETDTACRDGMEVFPVVYLTTTIPRLSKCEASLSVSSVGYKTLHEPKPCNEKFV
jgi:hypothetical protein